MNFLLFTLLPAMVVGIATRSELGIVAFLILCVAWLHNQTRDDRNAKVREQQDNALRDLANEVEILRQRVNQQNQTIQALLRQPEKAANWFSHRQYFAIKGFVAPSAAFAQKGSLKSLCCAVFVVSLRSFKFLNTSDTTWKPSENSVNLLEKRLPCGQRCLLLSGLCRPMRLSGCYR